MEFPPKFAEFSIKVTISKVVLVDFIMRRELGKRQIVAVADRRRCRGRLRSSSHLELLSSPATFASAGSSGTAGERKRQREGGRERRWEREKTVEKEGGRERAFFIVKIV